jgi:STE24 endopeptidase
MNWIYPTLIAPLFHKFTPLEEGELRERLEQLVERVGFSSGGVFVMDGSRRSSRANAYFTGFLGRKRIVLFDTLCEMLGPREIEAVLAHELGHFKLRHIWKGIAVSALWTLAGILVLSRLISWPEFYLGLGAGTASVPVALVLFAWVAPLFLFPLRPLFAAWSRRHEFQADAFAAAHADPDAMIRALVKLYEHNAATLTPDPLHSAFHDSHPPAPLRISRLSEMR